MSMLATTRHFAESSAQMPLPVLPQPAGWQRGPDIDDPGEISRGYSASGGVATGEEIAMLLRRHCAQPLSQLARWIVGGRIVSFDWRGLTLIPLFQFERETMAIRPEVTTVIDELAPAIDAIERARWFVTPNCWLGYALPVDVVLKDLPAVREAAWADRVIANGWS